MRRLKLPWRFLLPAVILPSSVVLWFHYYASVRASDDSQPAWSWYGHPVSAALNFPAYVYSGPANFVLRMVMHGLKVGTLWIDSRAVAFFLMVAVHWYWMGWKAEHWFARQRLPGRTKPGPALTTLYGLGATLWILAAIGSVQALVTVWLWLRHSDLFWGSEIYPFSCVLWSLCLSVYFLKSLVRGLRSTSK